MATASQDPTDYATFVVYLKRGSAPCERLRQLCLPHQDVLLQDVAQLKGKPPSWLVGVPTVVELPDYQVYTGTAALRRVEERLRSRVEGVGAATAATAAAAPLDEPRAAAPSSFGSALGFEEPPLLPDPRYDDAPPEKVGHAALEALMRRRQSDAPRAPL